MFGLSVKKSKKKNEGKSQSNAAKFQAARIDMLKKSPTVKKLCQNLVEIPGISSASVRYGNPHTLIVRSDKNITKSTELDIRQLLVDAEFGYSMEQEFIPNSDSSFLKHDVVTCFYIEIGGLFRPEIELLKSEIDKYNERYATYRLARRRYTNARRRFFENSEVYAALMREMHKINPEVTRDQYDVSSPWKYDSSLSYTLEFAKVEPQSE